MMALNRLYCVHAFLIGILFNVLNLAWIHIGKGLTLFSFKFSFDFFELCPALTFLGVVDSCTESSNALVGSIAITGHGAFDN